MSARHGEPRPADLTFEDWIDDPDLALVGAPLELCVCRPDAAECDCEAGR